MEYVFFTTEPTITLIISEEPVAKRLSSIRSTEPTSWEGGCGRDHNYKDYREMETAVTRRLIALNTTFSTPSIKTRPTT